MSADIIIPWRDDGTPERTAALGFLASQFVDSGYPVKLGSHRGEWCKAKAVQAGIQHSTATITVVHDADVWGPGLDEAIQAVADGAPWAIPHRKVHRLTAEATQHVLDGDQSFGGPLAQPAYYGVPGGGIVVLPRETYERVPLDPRFVGWGQQDTSWGLALTCLVGEPYRGAQPLWHLWHPPQQRKNRRVGSDANWALYKRYAKAARDPDAMRALIAEFA